MSSDFCPSGVDWGGDCIDDSDLDSDAAASDVAASESAELAEARVNLRANETKPLCQVRSL